MPQHAKTRVRCQIFPSKVGENFNNFFSGGTPKIYKGAGVDFEIVLFNSDGVLFDVANVLDFTLLVKPSGNPAGATEILKTVAPSGNINISQWNDGTGQHGIIPLLGSDTAIAAGTHDITIWGHTNDDGADPDIFGMSKLEVIDRGITAITNPAITANYPTLEQLNIALAGVVRFNGNPPGAKIRLESPNGLKFATYGADNDGNPDMGSSSTT